MRVALVVPMYLPHQGGMQRHVAELAKNLGLLGIEVDVLAAERDRSLPAITSEDSVTVRRFSVPVPTPRYTFSPGLMRFLRNRGSTYDVMHAHNYHELVPSVAASTHPKHLVVTPYYHACTRGILPRVLRSPHHLVAATALRRAEIVICVSRAEAQILSQDVRGVADHIVVIHPGVDVAQIRAAKPAATDGPLILVVSRLERYKRVDVVIQAAARLVLKRQLVIIGDGPERERLEELSARLEVPVRLVGQVSDEDLHRWLRAASVLVTMSQREGFGLTLLEAFAAGAAVVASDIPAHRESATYGPPEGSTFVHEAATAQVLALAIERALGLGANPVASTSLPTWRGMAEDTLRVYERLVR